MQGRKRPQGLDAPFTSFFGGVALAAALLGAVVLVTERSHPALPTVVSTNAVAPEAIAEDLIHAAEYVAPVEGDHRIARPSDEEPAVTPSVAPSVVALVGPSQAFVAQPLSLNDAAADSGTVGLNGAHVVAPADATELDRALDELEFDLAAIREGDMVVPRLYVSTLPDDLKAVPELAERKRLFLSLVLPLVLLGNEELRGQRARAEHLFQRLERGESLEPAEQAWLETLAEYYEVLPEDRDALMRRIDAVPVSLALAQAIVESGWGTSRFAREGNALFGERVWSENVPTMVPGKSKDIRVRAFIDLMDSVRAYLRNLNTHEAYAELRGLRAKARANDRQPDAKRLASTLTRYAELENYPEHLHGLMRTNGLAELDAARLESHSLARNPLLSAGGDG
jgi:Bax protein